jgi:hypothetical protein
MEWCSIPIKPIRAVSGSGADSCSRESAFVGHLRQRQDGVARSFGIFSQTRISANAIWTDVSRNPPITDTPRIFYGNMDALLS